CCRLPAQAGKQAKKEFCRGPVQSWRLAIAGGDLWFPRRLSIQGQVVHAPAGCEITDQRIQFLWPPDPPVNPSWRVAPRRPVTERASLVPPGSDRNGAGR